MGAIFNNFNFASDNDKSSHPKYLINFDIIEFSENSKQARRLINQMEDLIKNCHIQNDHKTIKASQKKGYDNYFQVRLIRKLNEIFNSKLYKKSRLLKYSQIADFIGYFNEIADPDNPTTFDEEYIKQMTRK